MERIDVVHHVMPLVTSHYVYDTISFVRLLQTCKSMSQVLRKAKICLYWNNNLANNDWQDRWIHRLQLQVVGLSALQLHRCRTGSCGLVETVVEKRIPRLIGNKFWDCETGSREMHLEELPKIEQLPASIESIEISCSRMICFYSSTIQLDDFYRSNRNAPPNLLPMIPNNLRRMIVYPPALVTDDFSKPFLTNICANIPSEMRELQIDNFENRDKSFIQIPLFSDNAAHFLQLHTLVLESVILPTHCAHPYFSLPAHLRVLSLKDIRHAEFSIHSETLIRSDKPKPMTELWWRTLQIPTSLEVLELDEWNDTARSLPNLRNDRISGAKKRMFYGAGTVGSQQEPWVLPASVKDGQFHACDVPSVVIPEDMEYLQIFDSRLEKITFGLSHRNLTEICLDVLPNVTALQIPTCHDEVKISISNCQSLTDITITGSFEYIEASNLENIKRVTVPITSFPERAFLQKAKKKYSNFVFARGYTWPSDGWGDDENGNRVPKHCTMYSPKTQKNQQRL